MTTVRLSDQLRKEADRCREREGLTTNGLIAVALREYIDRKRALELGGIVVAVPLETYQQAQGARLTPTTRGNRAPTRKQKRAGKKGKR